MVQETILETAVRAVDRILESPPSDLSSAYGVWQQLDQMLGAILDATKIDKAHHTRMAKLTASVRASASKLTRSIVNSKRGGHLRGDWIRFAERDSMVLKDDLLALKEFLVEEAEFLKFACSRAQPWELGRIDPVKLFEELHEAGAIGERTWVLLMSRPESKYRALKDKELSRQLARISGWFLDLQDARGGFQRAQGT